MSITSSINNAISGLTASARMAEVVSSNLSNALTDGYGRRVVDLSAANIGGKGAGVMIDGVRRIVDAGVLSDRRLADAALEGQQQNVNTLKQLETAVGLPGDPAGLAGRLNAFESALIDASTDPASSLLLTTASSRLGEVTQALSSASKTVQSLRQDADSQIARDVTTLNTALAQVATLNADISRARATGGDTTALQDARQRAVDQIAGIVPVREVPRDGGAIALMTTTGAQLLDGKAAVFEFTPTPTIVADSTFQSSALSGLIMNGQPVSVTDGVGKLTGGTLGANFDLRDNVLVQAQNGLDTIAVDLIARFADPAIDPSLTPGDPGLLTDGGNVYDPLDRVGLAGRIAVNASVDPTQGGDVTRLRDGVGAITPGPVGDTSQINRWLGALDQPLSTGPGEPSRTANGQIANLTSQFGTQRVQAEDTLTFAAARRDTLKSAELANGVDSDQELQRLILIEQSYAANAKLIQTIESMIRTLMEI
jgi:flagellar hook-associated protein 1 FlgK